LVGNPLVDQAKLMEKILENLGFKRPEAMLAPQEPQIPAGMIEQALSMLGVPNEAFMAAMDQIEAAQQDPQAIPEETG
jgi:hypothetical protein